MSVARGVKPDQHALFRVPLTELCTPRFVASLAISVTGPNNMHFDAPKSRQFKRRFLKIKRPPGYRTAAAAAYKRALERRYGSQGAASPVRKIDPVTGEIIAILEPCTPTAH